MTPCFIGSIITYFLYIKPGKAIKRDAWNFLKPGKKDDVSLKTLYIIFSILLLITLSGCPVISIIIRKNEKICVDPVFIRSWEIDEYRSAGYEIDDKRTGNLTRMAYKCYPKEEYHQQETAVSINTTKIPTATPEESKAPTASPRPTIRPTEHLSAIPTDATNTPHIEVVGQVLNGGNMRSDALIAPQTVIGQVCPGDTVEFISKKIAYNTSWYYIRIVNTSENCDPSRVKAEAFGWVSGSMLSKPITAIPTAP